MCYCKVTVSPQVMLTSVQLEVKNITCAVILNGCINFVILSTYMHGKSKTIPTNFLPL
jgi:hypothetical protein